MGSSDCENRTLFINDSEQEIDATKIKALHDEYMRCRERYEQSPSIENGSRMGEARTNLELARRAYKLHLDHMAEELLNDSEKTVKAVWRDENGHAIGSEFRNISKEGK